MTEKIDLRSLRARPLADLRLLGFHLAFVLAGGVLLNLTSPVPLGWRLFFAGVVYNLAFPLFASTCVEPRWIRIWAFLFPLSLLQILPDWHLAQNLETLVFPDLGAPTIGPVGVFMGLLWAPPLVLIVHVGERLSERWGRRAALAGSAGLSLLLFAAAEATLPLVPVWSAQNVTTLGPVALYVLVPEAILGAAAWWTFRKTDGRPATVMLAGAVAVMALYTLSLHVSWWLLEA